MSLISPDRVPEDAAIVLGAGVSQLSVYKELSLGLGIRLVGVDRDPGAVSFQYADSEITCSTHDAAGVLQGLASLGPRYNWKGVLTRSQGQPTVVCAQIAEALRLPGPSEQAARIAMDKALAVSRVRDAGLMAPEQLTKESLESGNVRYPVIVKPRKTAVGKRGIWRIRSAADWETYLQRGLGGVDVSDLEIESYVEGNDLLAMCTLQGGNVYPFALLSEYVGFSEDREIKGLGFGVGPRDEWPAPLTAFLASLAGAFGLTNGVMTVAVRETHRGYCFIELHLDLGGDLVLDTLLPAAGMPDPVLKFCYPFLEIKTQNRVREILHHTSLFYLHDRETEPAVLERLRRAPHAFAVDAHAPGRSHGYALLRAPDRASLLEGVTNVERILQRPPGLCVSLNGF